MEKTVKGATKIKLAAPKSKYVEAILSATHGGEAGVAEVFRTLQLRLRDSTWTIVFKALIIVHLMIREGNPDVTLRYIAESPKRLAISNFTEVQTQGANIRCYSDYLLERARGFRDTRTDYVRVGAGKLKKLTVDKGLLRETEVVQNEIAALVKCDMIANDDPHNEITLTAFRLVTMDLLELFKVMNEGTINILEHYFEMSRPDAERALNIYKMFGKQTAQVVQYLGLARQYEMATRLEVPKLKHAPTSLTSSLEDYLNDPNFELNRKQFLAQQGGKRDGKPVPSTATRSTPVNKEVKVDNGFPASTQSVTKPVTNQQPKAPAPDLIDFFESIEQNQQPMAQQAAPQQQYAGGQPYQQPAQQTGYNPFLQPGGPAYGQIQLQQQQQPLQQQPLQQQPLQQQPLQQQPLQQQPQQQQPPQSLQPDFTGAGFGGYTPQLPQQQHQPFQPALQSIPQNGALQMSPESNALGYQAQNPIQTNLQSPTQPLQRQNTSSNPFRQSAAPTGTSASAPSSSPPLRQSTNPFARNPTSQAATQQHQAASGFSFENTQSSSPFTSPPPQTQHSELQANSAIFSSPTSTSPPMSQLSQPAPQLQPQRTGTNPFARNLPPPASLSPVSPLVASPTGSTNPFRQSAFVNQQTGTGWQHSQQGTFSGFNVNNVDTVPVFPRPGQS